MPLARWTSTTFAALDQRDFRILWIGSLFATLAFMMMFLAQAVVAFELAGTNSAVGVVSLGVGVSMLLVGPFGGVTADRVSKRTLIILGQGAAAALFVLTGVLIITDTLSLLLLVLITTVMGLGFAFMGPARHAYVADIVAPERLANAIALSQLGHSGGQILAPLIAGILLSTAAIGAGGVYLLMGALLFIGVASIGFLPSRAGPPHARGSVLSELGAGLQHVRSRPRLRLVLLMYVAVVMLGWTFRVVLPALLERDLDRAADIGLLFSVNAIAGFVVSLGLAGMVGTRWAWPALFVLATLLALGYFVLAAAPTFGFALLSMVLLGPGFASFMLVAQTMIMANTAPAFYGRVMSLTMLAFGVQSIIALPFGALADLIGERESLALLGAVTLAVVGISLLGYLRLIRGLAAAGRAHPAHISAPETPVAAAQKSSRP